jgi:hypothetical protein
MLARNKCSSLWNSVRYLYAIQFFIGINIIMPIAIC